MRTRALAWIVVFLCAGAAGATPLRLVVEGRLDSIDDAAGALAGAGVSLLAGDRFRVDVTGPGDDSWSGSGQVGSLLFSAPFTTDAANDRPVLGDELVLGTSSPAALGSTGLTVIGLSVRLLDATATAIGADVFPTAIDLADWGDRFFLFSGQAAGGETFRVLGTPESVSLTAVPESQTAVLVGLGLVALGARRRRVSAGPRSPAGPRRGRARRRPS